MLFTEDYVKRVGKYQLYFVGTTRLPMYNGTKVLLVTGSKSVNGMIYTLVEEFTLDTLETKIRFENMLEPAKFEHFLNKLAMNIASNEQDNKLVELTLRKSNLIEPLETLDEKGKQMMTNLFLILAGFKDEKYAYKIIQDVTVSIQQGKGYDHIMNIIRGVQDKIKASI